MCKVLFVSVTPLGVCRALGVCDPLGVHSAAVQGEMLGLGTAPGQSQGLNDTS